VTKLTAPVFLSLSLPGFAQAGPSGEAYAQVVQGQCVMLVWTKG